MAGPKAVIKFMDLDEVIRIHHECEGGIEKYVLRITDCHQEAC